MHDPGPILCAVSDHRPLPQVAVARRLAELFGRPVRFVHVPTLGPPLHLPDERINQHVRRAHQVLERVGVEAHERRVALGPVVPALLSVASEERASLLVTGCRQRGRLKSAVLGSVSRELMRTARCPVMIVPHLDGPPFAHGPIVCGVDDGPEVRQVVDAARGLAERTGRPLLLAHVVEAIDSAVASAPHAVVAQAFEPIPPAAAAQAVKLLANAVEPVPPHVWTELAVRGGSAAHELVRLAAELDADALVVASKGRGAIRTALLGSTAQEVTKHAHCPVLVVPPDRATADDHAARAES